MAAPFRRLNIESNSLYHLATALLNWTLIMADIPQIPELNCGDLSKADAILPRSADKKSNHIFNVTKALETFHSSDQAEEAIFEAGRLCTEVATNVKKLGMDPRFRKSGFRFLKWQSEA